VLVQTDARKEQMLSRVEQAPTAGATIELTIDQNLQHIAERELAAGIAINRARGGSAIIMDPQTGEVLAMANAPTFDPNLYGRASDEDRRNRSVAELYEPGSTFKIVTASAAIEEGVLKPSDLIDCSPGYITFPGRKPIRDVHTYGVLSFEDVIVKSSNVGAIRAGLRVGADRLGRYVRRFGFGEKIAPDFAGENKGIVHPSSDLSDSDLASMSMGYAVGVTPIQMASAVSAVANGGMLMEPHLVRATIVNGVRQPVAPRAVRRAIAPETSAILTTIMEQVVVRGTAKAAALTRYQVAGKTGTAAKLIDGRYSDTFYNASFVGFVPSRRPAFAIVVVVDSPTAGRMYGGDVAAPVFKRIADAALQQMGILPTVDPVPPVVIVSNAEGPAVHPAVATAPMPALTYLGGRTLMPDVRGMSGRDALRVLGAVGLQVRMSGQGVVSTQTPEPGEPVDSGNWSVLQLQRATSPPSAGGVR
jgi:cell division protein FtsI (penicillin-binding protein 3)